VYDMVSDKFRSSSLFLINDYKSWTKGNGVRQPKWKFRWLIRDVVSEFEYNIILIIEASQDVFY